MKLATLHMVQLKLKIEAKGCVLLVCFATMPVFVLFVNLIFLCILNTVLSRVYCIIFHKLVILDVTCVKNVIYRRNLKECAYIKSCSRTLQVVNSVN